jgi:hypothetical protein
MRLSRYFMPILKENPKEAEIVSHRLMLRAGMIRQQSQGIYSWLPLGKRVLDKVNNIIREEQNRSGAIELSDADAAVGRSLAGKRPLRRLWQGDAAHQGPPGSRRCSMARPTRKWSPISSAPTSSPTRTCRSTSITSS